MCLPASKDWEEATMCKFKFWLVVILLCHSVSLFAIQPDSVVVEAEEDKPKYEYWKKAYYSDINKVDSLERPINQSFDEMVGKYQNSEFEYIESISDKLSIWNSIKNWINKFLSDLFPNINASPGDWFYDLLGIAGAAFVIFLLYKFFFSGRQFIINSKEDSKEENNVISYVEKNLMDVDINSYIQTAVESNNYALAIRYQQLLNIQLLAKKNFISWEQSKTNLELMDEIEETELKTDFKKCTSLFEYVWFGDFAITAEKFTEISNQFKAFQRRWA